MLDPITQIRNQFPALQRDAIFLDNPAGTQVPRIVLDRITQYLIETNANKDGAFPTSRVSDAVLNEARAAAAALLNAARPEEIAFGANMTTLTLGLSRALGNWINPGDRIVVTRLDHDANIAPWLRMAQDRGAVLDWVDFDVETGTLRLDTFEAALARKPKLAAFGYASNALGTVNPVKEMTTLAHAAGARVFVDAVQYVPHGVTDVQEIGCDFLACSAYKFFGPHVGILYGKYDLMAELPAYKVRPASDLPPGRWETGTQNHEGIAGTLGAVEYYEWVGVNFGGAQPNGDRRARLVRGLAYVAERERELSLKLIDTLESVPGLRVYGLMDRARVGERVPTFSCTLAGWHPQELAAWLGERGVYVWDGNYYALAVTERLGLETGGGMVRIGAVHYNTAGEIERLGALLREAAHRPLKTQTPG
jgi:cysteine desulfurase family protein (TIGR01976 family)